MKTIGILGGMSAASTQLYYQYLCNLTREQCGGLHSPELLIRSVNFAEIERYQMSDNWLAAAEKLNHEARSLERGGAQILVLATNTMHKLIDDIMHGVNIPYIHLADATATRIKQDGLKSPGLMATRFTMEQDFYTARLALAGLNTQLPDENDRQLIHRIIYEELCKDNVREDSRIAYEQVAQRLIDGGADSLILGCTEVGMLLNSSNVTVPVFDTTRIHCEAALQLALKTD